MKTAILLSIITVALLPAREQVRAETVDFNSLPLSVQEAINAHRGTAGIVSIDRVTRFGRPVYEVHLDQPANNDLFINDTGLVADGSTVVAGTPGLTETREVLFSALPPAVQNTIRAQLGNVPMPNVDMVTVNGQTTYVVPSHIEDRAVDLWIDPNGNLVTLSPPRVLMSDGVRVNPQDLPLAVQETLRTYAEGAPLSNIRRGVVQGQIVYDATFQHFGHNVDLRVAEDGSLVRDAINDRFLAETGRMSRQGLVANAPARAPLVSRVPVSFNQVPPAVLSTLQTYARSDFIERIDKGVSQGQTVYEALFRHGADEVPLRIADNGSLINDRVNDWFLAQVGATTIPVGQAPIFQSGTGSGR